MSDVRHVAIMVCTRGRPDVRQACFAALGLLQAPDGVRVSVVVGDNNAPLADDMADDGMASELTATGLGFTIVRESEAGYCFIRNAVLRAVLKTPAEILIFIDDDHAVEPDLVTAYLGAFDTFGADVVHGSYVGSSRRYREGQRPRRWRPTMSLPTTVD